jgi:hypothetical protein
VWGVKELSVRYTILEIFAVFAAVFFVGCLNPTEPYGPATGSKVLVVYIADEAPAERTALPPAPVSARYTISVTHASPGDLGSATFTTPSGPYLVELSAAPAVGDEVKVESFDSSNMKNAEGTYTLTSGDISGASVSVTLSPAMTGTGSVDLSVSFNRLGTDGEITLAELKLYGSLAAYKTGTDLPGYRARYQKDNTYGTGTGTYLFAGTTPEVIPLNYAALASGNYVLMIEFFRGAFGSTVKVSRLVQTIIVRGGLETKTWVESGSSVLTWNAFASSKAELAGTDGITLNGTTVTGYAPATTTYNIYEATTAIPTKTLTVTRGEQGQAIEVSLNGGASVPLVSGTAKAFSALGTPGLKNTLAITVTAPDGLTQKTYTVNISGKELIDFYFEIGGKVYGLRPSGTPAPESGSWNSTTNTVTIPYGTNLAATARTPVITHSGASINPAADTAWDSAGSKTYRVAAFDSTDYVDYTVTVQEQAGVTVGITGPDGFAAFTLDMSPGTAAPTGTITLDGNKSFDSCHIYISGPVSSTPVPSPIPSSTSPVSTVTFAAPGKPGFYNINVIVTIGGTEYSKSFGLTVE